MTGWWPTTLSRRRRAGGAGKSTKSDPYYDWLDTRKNLGGRARAEASGRVKIRTPDGKNRRWVERADVERQLEEGWLLD